MESLRDQTDSRRLRQEIYDLIDYIFSLPNATDGITESVHQTLMTCAHPDVGLRPLPIFTGGPNPDKPEPNRRF